MSGALDSDEQTKKSYYECPSSILVSQGGEKKSERDFHFSFESHKTIFVLLFPVVVALAVVAVLASKNNFPQRTIDPKAEPF